MIDMATRFIKARHREQCWGIVNGSKLVSQLIQTSASHSYCEALKVKFTQMVANLLIRNKRYCVTIDGERASFIVTSSGLLVQDHFIDIEDVIYSLSCNHAVSV